MLYYKYRLLGIFPSLLDRFGFTQGVRLFTQFLFNVNAVQVRVPGVAHPIVVRVSTSDIVVFREIFVDENHRVVLKRQPSLIIDGGANAGYSSVYFANQYPDAIILAVEPEDSNIYMLKENCAPYPNIEPIHSAIWGSEGFLRIANPTAGKWGFIVKKAREGEPDAFKAITISSLLKRTGKKRIDILKLDIEGAEKEVFSSNETSWLGAVEVLLIELHDYMSPGCKEPVVAASKVYGLSIAKRSGYNYVFTRDENT